MAVPERRFGDLKADQTVFFLCDMQEKFRPAIKYFTEIMEVSRRLIACSKILEVPLIVTEQYPKGLGSTVPELEIAHAVKVFPKTKFSMVLPEVLETLKSACGGKARHMVLFGIETHVCIQQTVIDLLTQGYEVHVVADGCSSRSQTDRIIALQRFRQMGAWVTTSEGVILQLLGDKNHEHFKEVQKLIMTSAPDTGLAANL